MPKKLRTIVELPLVATRVDQGRQEYPYFDDWWTRGLTWWLARKPLVGKRVPGLQGKFALETQPVPQRRIPAVRVMYSVTENEVIIERIAIYDDEPDKQPSPENVIKHMLNTPPPKKAE